MKEPWYEKLIEGISVLFSTRIVEGLQDMTHKAQDVVHESIKNVMRQLFYSFMFLFATVLIIIAILMLIREYIGLSMGWILLFVGVLTFALALGVKGSFNRNKHYKF